MWEVIKKVCTFKHTIHVISYETIEHYLASKGWKILIIGTDKATELILTLNLEQLINNRSAIVYNAGGLKVIFIQPAPASDMLYYLLHEIGHIIMNHDLAHCTSKEERQANLFAEFCLEFSKLKKVIQASLLFLIITLTVTIGGGQAEIANLRQEILVLEERADALQAELTSLYSQIKQYQEAEAAHGATLQAEVYVTESGDKYHLAECRYLEDKDVHRLTVEEAIKEGYGPCAVCEPPTT